MIFKGVQTVKLKTTGIEKLRFTVALTAGVQRATNGFKGVRLPPLSEKSSQRKFCSWGVCTRIKGGTMTQKMMLESYLPKMFKRRPGGHFNSASPLMIMDSAT